MFSFEADNVVILQEHKALEAALSTNPKTQKALQKLIRKVIFEARKSIVNATHKELKHDPREAARAVRTTVYRKILGGNVNIYNTKKAHGTTPYRPPRKLEPGQRGGNRRPRSMKTARYMSYNGLDRGFILRWVDDGTRDRSISFVHNNKRKVDKWNKHPNTGNRGRMTNYNFFVRFGENALNRAADKLAGLIETELAATLDKMKK